VYDKTVRRRRAVLALLVASSLILLTAYFGESAGGGLHAIQRGVMDVVSPIQEGASRALKPVRDLFGWVGDTVDAKGDLKRVKKDRDELRRQAIADQAAARENRSLRELLGLDRSLGIDAYGPETARVIGQSPTLWYATITIDKGTSAGIEKNMPVLASDGKERNPGTGLVGRVTVAARNSAVVTLITDQSFATGVIAGAAREPGSIEPAVGAPGDLLLEPIDNAAKVRAHDFVYTAGTTSSRLESRYPPAILIGTVDRVDLGEGDLDRRIHVKPAADLKRLDMVQVLTEPHADLPGAR